MNENASPQLKTYLYCIIMYYITKLLWITKALMREGRIIRIYCLLNRSKHVYGKQFYFDIPKSLVEANETILKTSF